MSLEAIDLDVAFGEIAALRGVSLRLPAARITAVVGPNAAGKTTLLRCLAGVLAPDGGEVRLDGTPLGGLAVGRRAPRIAYLGQRSSVVGGHSAAAVVSFGGLTRPRDAAGIDSALRDVGLHAEAGRPFEDLSAGQRQRVSLARAIHQVAAPSEGWLILDEPFAAQDPREVVRILERLAGWRAAGGSAVIAIHDLRIARAIADEVVLLRDGAMMACGATETELVASRMATLFEVPFEDTAWGPVARFDGPDGPGNG